MAVKKKDIETVVEVAETDITQAYYVCTQKCYFDSRLWKPDEATVYIPGIENCPYFKQL